VAALRSYVRTGFHQVEAFGAYVGMPPAALVSSAFLEKSLPAAERTSPRL
jgi:hypothetical protein